MVVGRPVLTDRGQVELWCLPAQRHPFELPVSEQERDGDDPAAGHAGSGDFTRPERMQQRDSDLVDTA